VKRGLNLPSDWDYVNVVLPALKLGQPLAHVMNASPLIERGLDILQIATSSQARAGISGIKLKSKTGLIVPVTDIERDMADQLKRRFNREAKVDGDVRWRTRDVLACAFFFGAQPKTPFWGEGP
jgi:hypothetical protein